MLCKLTVYIRMRRLMKGLYTNENCLTKSMTCSNIAWGGL